jgi:hypothetical protein
MSDWTACPNNAVLGVQAALVCGKCGNALLCMPTTQVGIPAHVWPPNKDQVSCCVRQIGSKCPVAHVEKSPTRTPKEWFADQPLPLPARLAAPPYQAALPPRPSRHYSLKHVGSLGPPRRQQKAARGAAAAVLPPKPALTNISLKENPSLALISIGTRVSHIAPPNVVGQHTATNSSSQE